MAIRSASPMLRLAPVLLALVAAQAEPPVKAPAKASISRIAAPGLDLAGMDASVAPGEDFFAYANGGWVKATEIPADRSAYGVGAQVVELTDRRTADLIRALAGKPSPEGSEARKIGDTYTSFLDEAAIEARGLRPLQPALDRIAALRTRQDLARELGSELQADVDVLNATHLTTPRLLGLWVAADLNDPTRYVPFLLQGGLYLPDREYYLAPAPAMATLRTQYQAHIAAMLQLAGVADAPGKAAQVMALEMRMAEVHGSREATGDVAKGNNPWRRADFDTKAPGLDWAAYFAAAGLGFQADFIVWQPGAITGLSALVASEPLEVWQAYLTYHALQDRSAVLPRAFRDQTFAFFGQALRGAAKPRDRWKQAVNATNNALGEAVGRRYAAKYFPASEKARAQAMVANILAAFRRRIDQLDWMSPATKAKAKAKLDVLKVGVGYPDRWRDYAGLQVVRGDAFGNAVRAERFETQRNLAKLGRPVDRGEWVMTPQTVNAVNLPVMNAMNFPAAILQPPFFDPRRSAAMDYGAIGAVIGHEISHSFDDQGALFDDAGRFRNWWTPEDLAHFQASGTQLVKQYDGYKPFPDLAVNGRQTLGENIADVAGLAAALDAYHLSLKGRPAKVVAGLTGDQQFFLSFAQAWRQKSSERALRNQVLTDGHAPEVYRTFTVRNLDAWYQAFPVKPGQALYLKPEERVKVW